MAIPVDYIILAAILVPGLIFSIVFLCTWNAYADWHNKVRATQIWDEKKERVDPYMFDGTLMLQLGFVQIQKNMPRSLRLGIVVVRCFLALFALCIAGLIVMALVVRLPS